MGERVRGKIAIVTGGAGGLGAAYSRRLIEEGGKVLLTDVSDEQGAAIAKELGANARFMHHDVAKEKDWQRAVTAAEAAFGPVSVLVNNAGIGSDGESIEALDEADYRRTIDINQISVFLGMKTVIPSMTRAGGGSIINISSMAGLVGVANCLAYCASKFAVRGMTKVAALELARFNIRVNSIHPGLIRTPLIAVTPENKAILTAAIEATPAGRVGEPEEIANVVLLLASDESRFSTGAEFVVDGGFTSM